MRKGQLVIPNSIALPRMYSKYLLNRDSSGRSLLFSVVSCNSVEGLEMDSMFWKDTFEGACLCFSLFLLGVDVASGTISLSLQLSVHVWCKKHWALWLSITLFCKLLSVETYEWSFQLLGIRCSSSSVSWNDNCPSSWNHVFSNSTCYKYYVRSNYLNFCKQIYFIYHNSCKTYTIALENL